MGKTKRLIVVVSVLTAVFVSSGLAHVWLASSTSSEDPSHAGVIPLGPTRFIIPGWVFSGDQLTIGLNIGGTFITGGWSIIPAGPAKGAYKYPTAGFQFPGLSSYPECESLAVPNLTNTFKYAAADQWVEGYSIAYRIYNATSGKWEDRISYWWPALGWDYRTQTESRNGPPNESSLIYWKSSLERNDADRTIVRSFMNTTDGAFTLKFTFSFPKHQAYVELRTDIYSYKSVKDITYKRIVDWDAMNKTYTNQWSSGPNVAYARETFLGSLHQILSVTGYGYVPPGSIFSLPVYVDLWAWDDLKKEGPGSFVGYDMDWKGIIQSPAGWISGDYCAAITYELGTDMVKGDARSVLTVYQAALDGRWIIPS